MRDYVSPSEVFLGIQLSHVLIEFRGDIIGDSFSFIGSCDQDKIVPAFVP